jgi:NADH-quinone oxidoreductase subunit L
MQTVGQQLIIAAIPILPALIFFVLALLGRLLRENAQYVAILGVTVSLVFSVFALLYVAGVIPGGGSPIEFSVNWIDLGAGGSFSMGVYIDGLAAVMLVVGLCSYLLIGHWYEKPSARDAALKAFIVTRIGDAALFIAIIIFWARTGTTSFEGISEAAQAGFIGGSLFATAVVLVFVGAVGKSAQFPLHVWLPDAMEGPTPVSALIHAATMVAAGVYLVARTYDIFVQSEQAMLVVAYVGGFTALMAATMALVKKDIKRVVAYSTVSQLGYMMLGLGIGSYTAGIFHLYNHAFFKALLFLCAGSIIHAMDSYNLFDMGGLRRRMPITFWAMVIAGLSLAGIFPFAGFWSKDAIVASTYDEHYYVLFGMALLTVFLTAFYIFRAIFLAFTGEPRTDGARAAAESPGIMTGPMVILAFLSVVSGWVGIPEGSGIPVHDYFAELVVPSGFARETLGIEPHPFSLLMAAISVSAALVGIGLAYALYVQRPERAGELSRRFSGIYTFLDKGWYFDALYGATFVRGALVLGRITNVFDGRVLGNLVGGVGRGVSSTGELLRRLQSGGVQSYALFILVGALILAIIVGGQYAALMVAVIALITITAFAVGARL